MAKKPVDKGRKAESKGRRPLKPAPTKKKSEKAARPKPEPEAPAPVRGGARIPFICSECYEDFSFRGEAIGDTITCPECLHVGKKPDPDFLNTVLRHKSGERSALLMAVLSAALALVAGLGFIHFSSGLNPTSDNETLRTILIGASGLLGLAGIILAVRYERNRWEIYF